MAGKLRLTLRIDLGDNARLGHGKVLLLERIAEMGSIAAAARSMDMSYRRAWLLIDELNRNFRRPVVSARTGGSRGGAAEVTEFGKALAGRYRRMESDVLRLLARDMAAIEADTVTPRPAARGDRRHSS